MEVCRTGGSRPKHHQAEARGGDAGHHQAVLRALQGEGGQVHSALQSVRKPHHCTGRDLLPCKSAMFYPSRNTVHHTEYFHVICIWIHYLGLFEFTPGFLLPQLCRHFECLLICIIPQKQNSYQILMTLVFPLLFLFSLLLSNLIIIVVHFIYKCISGLPRTLHKSNKTFNT